MAQFDESKVINALHPERAEVGKKYWYSDSIMFLKEYIEQNNTVPTGILSHIDVNSSYVFLGGSGSWEFIYPYEEPSKQRMTNRQLAEWLSKGNGQWKYKSDIEMSICTEYMYYENKEDKRPKNIIIRPFGTDTWIEPTVDIYERDCKKE